MQIDLVYIYEKRYIWLLYGYFLFLAGFFVFPDISYVYYYVLFAVSVIVFYRDHKYGLFSKNIQLVVWMVYFLYMWLTCLWTEDFTWSGYRLYSWHLMEIMVFIFMPLVLVDELPDEFSRFMDVLIYVAALNALFSIIVFYSHSDLIIRLSPLGAINNELLAGCVFGLFALLAILNSNMPGRKTDLSLQAAAAVLALAVLLTQTRTALVALLVSGIIVLKRHLFILTTIVVSYILLIGYDSELMDRLLRGTSYRDFIWKNVIDEILSGNILNLIFGYGCLKQSSMVAEGFDIQHAHNVYLATLRDGGIVGLSLFCAALLSTLKRAYAIDRMQGFIWAVPLLIYVMVVGVFDFDKLVIKPREFWVIFFFPVSLILAADSTC